MNFSRRIAAQRSRFTIFGRAKHGLKSVSNRAAESRLIKYDVKQEAITQMKRDLWLADNTIHLTILMRAEIG